MLTESQKRAIRDVRTDFKQLAVALWTVSKNDVNTNDIYGRATTITSGSRMFSGSIAWRDTVLRLDAPGGYYNTSTVTIVVSLDEKDYIDAENKYLVCEGIKLRMKDFAQATDTNELVISCERLNE